MSNTMTTMSNIAAMPRDVFVKRSDPVYMAHSYLTKVPLAASASQATWWSILSLARA
jgi:hypothetical protein